LVDFKKLLPQRGLSCNRPPVLPVKGCCPQGK
jgi:hypothetical protein